MNTWTMNNQEPRKRLAIFNGRTYQFLGTIRSTWGSDLAILVADEVLNNKHVTTTVFGVDLRFIENVWWAEPIERELWTKSDT